jgi:methionine synthase II (cobalamin-independent)
MEDSKAVKVVNEALSDVPDQVRKEEKLIVHVCGPLTKSQFENLCHLDAPVLSLAFGSKSVKGNVDLVSKEDFESSGKKLGLGCVSVQARTKDEVEPTAPVIERVKIILDRVGEERIALLHPDCGMRGTGNEALGLILDRVASSAEYIEKTR